jgi:hypothetical protein
MFIFDIETLGTRSDSVILSWACIYFESGKVYNYAELYSSAFFIKLDVLDQRKRLNRYIDRGTVDWWDKQCDLVKRKSFIPQDGDMKVEDAYYRFKEWVEERKEGNYYVWARGNLDQIVFDDLQKSIGLETIFNYNRWRDVRTAVDLMYNRADGYCDIEGFDRSVVYKHDPVHDCAYDVMMLLYGKEEVDGSD